MTVNDFFRQILNVVFSGNNNSQDRYSVRIMDFRGESHDYAIMLVDEDYNEIAKFETFAEMRTSEEYKEISNREFVSIDEIHIEKYKNQDYSFIRIIVK